MNTAHKIDLMPGHKWIRYFRFQLAVRQTANNRARHTSGRGQVGRPVPRLVSIDFDDVFQVPVDWSVRDAVDYARSCGIAYFAVFIDGEYYAIPNSDVPAETIQAALDAGKIVVLPVEGISKW